MALPGVNQFLSSAYHKMDNMNKTNYMNKQAAKDKADKYTSKNKDVYGESAQYVSSKNDKAVSKEEIDPVSGTSQKVELSDKAKEYLEKLRAKYSNMDIMAGDNLSDEETQRYLNQGKGEYSVMIDVDTLEKMADDESVRAEYEGILDNAGSTFKSIKEDLGEDAAFVKSIGISFDSEGNTKYYCIIDQSLEKRSFIDKKEKNDNKEVSDSKKKTELKSNDTEVSQLRIKEDYKKPYKDEVTISSDDIKDFIDKIKETIDGLKKVYVKNQIPNFDVTV